MHTMSLNPNHKAGTWAYGLLLGVIAAQPALDSLTYWLMITGRTNWVAYVRAAALGLFGLLVLVQERKLVRWGLSVVWAAYVLSKYVLAEGLLPGSGFTETSNMLRTMIAPMFTIWLFWHVREDPRRGARVITQGLLAAAAILAALAAASFLTGTYQTTYQYGAGANKPDVVIGFTGWSYSPNAQSIVLSVLLGLSAPVLARWRRPWALLGLLAAFWLMLFCHATRTAYYSMLLMGAALLGALTLQLLLRGRPRWWAVAAAAMFLILAFALKPLSPLTEAEHSRDKIRNIAGYLQQGLLVPNPDPDGPMLIAPPSASPGTPEPAATPAPTPSATARPADEMARWDAQYRDHTSMFYFTQRARDNLYSLKERSRFDSARMDAAAYEYIKERMALPPAKIVDNRLSQSSYVIATMRHADALRLLTGFGVTWYTDVLGSVENDYAAMLGYFGLLGCAVVFGVAAWALWMSLRLMNFRCWRCVRRFFTPEILMSLAVVIMMLGLGAFSGRAFQQGSTSIYLSLALALLYCHARQAAQEADPAFTSSEKLAMPALAKTATEQNSPSGGKL